MLNSLGIVFIASWNLFASSTFSFKLNMLNSNKNAHYTSSFHANDLLVSKCASYRCQFVKSMLIQVTHWCSHVQDKYALMFILCLLAYVFTLYKLDFN